ncbi:hypothetical protein OH77DRAFT_1416556 [Trametes cingulata]|nr:hypothetical protein OH77DRAFT_1416556 [Trametes cingulata]
MSFVDSSWSIESSSDTPSYRSGYPHPQLAPETVLAPSVLIHRRRSDWRSNPGAGSVPSSNQRRWISTKRQDAGYIVA